MTSEWMALISCCRGVDVYVVMCVALMAAELTMTSQSSSMPVEACG